MVRFLSACLAMSALAGLASCKPAPTNEARDLSITAPGQVAGKWLATLTIVGSLDKVPAELLANTLKGFFLSERGGKYTPAFDLSDKSGWKPNKAEIVEKFSALRKTISVFKANNPSAPAMVTIGLTGHGMSQNVFSKVKDGYQFAVRLGQSESDPGEHFSGSELAALISSLGADEVLVFCSELQQRTPQQRRFHEQICKHTCQ